MTSFVVMVLIAGLLELDCGGVAIVDGLREVARAGFGEALAEPVAAAISNLQRDVLAVMKVAMAHLCCPAESTPGGRAQC